MLRGSQSVAQPLRPILCCAPVHNGRRRSLHLRVGRKPVRQVSTANRNGEPESPRHSSSFPEWHCWPFPQQRSSTLSREQRPETICADPAKTEYSSHL